jgi:L-asparaginase
MTMPRIAVIALGGTIASTGTTPSAGVVPTLTAGDLVKAVPQLINVATIYAETLLAKPSPHLDFDDLLLVRERLDRLVSENYDGVVVTQGTDTLEETAFAIDLCWEHETPVVFTGAMRHPTSAGADGPANLLAAVTVASAKSARGRGVLVVMNDEIHAARYVRKMNTSKVSAFSSTPHAPLGVASESRVIFSGQVPRPVAFSVPKAWDSGVEIVIATLGGSMKLWEHLVVDPPSGVVVAGFGGGHVRAEVASLLEKIAERVPVVLASRVGAGPVLESTYGFVGSEIDLLGKGLISAGDLPPIKARLLLSLLLGGGGTREEIAARFSDYVQWGCERPLLP